MEQQNSIITANTSGGGNRMDAQDDTRIDGALVNGLTGMGVYGRDKSQHTRVNFSYLLSHPELEALYTIGLPRRFVDAIADAVLKHRVTITLGGNNSTQEIDKISEFETYLQNLKVYRAYSEAIRLQRLYGGSAIVLLIDDGEVDFSKPVRYKNIRSIRGLCTLSRHEILPLDLSVMDWSSPARYRITTNKKIDPNQTSPTTNLEIHSSRVVRFDGLYLPWRQRQQQQGWGQAPLQVVYDAWREYESAVRGLGSSITDASVFWHKIPGLMNTVKAGGTSAVLKRMELNNLSRSTYGGMILDKDEEIGFSERALGNMASALVPFAEYMQATTGWPASILMGTSPGGLGKEGRFEERVWASLVEDWQTVYCQEPLQDLFSVLMQAQDSPMGGKLPPSWKLSFPSLFVETDTEKVAKRTSQAQVDQIYHGLRVLTTLEIRNNRFGAAEYSLNTVLDENATAQLEMQQGMEFENGINQLQAQAFAAQGLGPDGQPIPPEGVLPDQEQDPPEQGDPPPESQNESQESQSQEPAAGKPKRTPKTDHYQDLEIDVIRHIDGMSLGRAQGGPDRADSADPDLSGLILLGPHRSRRYHTFRSSIQLDGQVLPGPRVTAFASLRAARKGLAAFLPAQTVFTFTPTPEDDK